MSPIRAILAFLRTQGQGLRIFRVHPEHFPASIYAPIIAKTSYSNERIN